MPLRILLSGASSFTGFWFARELRQAGHQVVCAFRGPSESGYGALRGWRVATLCQEGPSAFGCDFGSEQFLEVARGGEWDVYCHHAADVTNYRSHDFDAVRALESNTRNLRQVLAELKTSGCTRVMLTGSVFEGGEGAGSEGLPSILPYGLSKALTASVFEYETRTAGMSLGKFVIPNPFGPYQEPRFLEYLVGKWRNGEVAGVSTPEYVRDNIPVDLLALDYRHFVESLSTEPGFARRSPSGIVGDQGAFARLAASEIRGRTGWECALDLAHQTEFAEPRIRINTDPAAPRHPQWSAAAVWDQIAGEGSDPL